MSDTLARRIAAAVLNHCFTRTSVSERMIAETADVVLKVLSGESITGNGGGMQQAGEFRFADNITHGFRLGDVPRDAKGRAHLGEGKVFVSTTAQMLLDAAAAHMKQRAADYDQPQGERSIPKVVEAFNTLTDHELSESEGWLFMELLKIVRDRAGKPHRDSIEDHVSYAALYGEARLKEGGAS